MLLPSNTIDRITLFVFAKNKQLCSKMNLAKVGFEINLMCEKLNIQIPSHYDITIPIAKCQTSWYKLVEGVINSDYVLFPELWIITYVILN
jgi:hypothetical protein